MEQGGGGWSQSCGRRHAVLLRGSLATQKLQRVQLQAQEALTPRAQTSNTNFAALGGQQRLLLRRPEASVSVVLRWGVIRGACLHADLHSQPMGWGRQAGGYFMRLARRMLMPEWTSMQHPPYAILLCMLLLPKMW